MTKLFTCDNCGKTFINALDEVLHTDENGNLVSYDMCAPCRGLLNTDVSNIKKEFFKKLKNKKK